MTSSGPDEQKSIQSLQCKASSFKTPNITTFDYTFTADEANEETKQVNPILGTPEVREIHNIDWASLKYA